jgi:uncharacterized protein (DUF1015 family)
MSPYICPPYDVISAQEREEWVRRSPYNVIQLELPSGEDQEKYPHASRILARWRDQGVLQLDRLPSYYVLESTFRTQDPFAPGTRMKRYGVLTALHLETPRKGAVKPHEKTLPKAKEDRLNLLNALNSNVSPIFGLFFDKKKEWKKWLSKVTKLKPLAFGKENDNLSHRMWKVDQPALQKSLTGLLKGKDLYIADGHHRYEVSWAYKESRLNKEPNADLGTGWNYVMAYVCPMEESGLLMLPTHRLIKSSWKKEEWEKHLSGLFSVTPVKNSAALIKALLHGKGRRLGWAHQNGFALLTLRTDISLERCLQNRPAALRDLDVVLLHDMALCESSPVSDLANKEVIYTRDVKLLCDQVKKDSSWTGFLVASSGVSSLARVASANEVMPPKSTYFYPKVPTGFTLMPLEQKLR